MKKIEMFLPVKTAAFLRPSCRILTKRYFASAPVPPSFGDSPFETAKRVVGCPSAPMRVMPNPYGPYAAVSPTTPLIDIHSTTVHFAADYLGKSMASSSEGDTGSSIPHVFLTVDVDACPRAAYHADIDDVPTVVVMMGDDALRKKIAPIDRCDASSILDRMEQVIEAFDTTSIKDIANYRSQSAWYDHNIRMDNLNALRVGWPTAS